MSAADKCQDESGKFNSAFLPSSDTKSPTSTASRCNSLFPRLIPALTPSPPLPRGGGGLRGGLGAAEAAVRGLRLRAGPDVGGQGRGRLTLICRAGFGEISNEQNPWQPQNCRDWPEITILQSKFGLEKWRRMF